MGYAKIGMTLGELKEILGQEGSFEAVNLGVDMGQGIQVSQSGEVLYDIASESFDGMSDPEEISFIRVRNRVFRTEEGVGPGTPLKDAIAAYGKATLGINVEDESREYITFERGLSDNVLFRSNQWALDGEAGVYEPDANREPYRSTALFKPQAAIG
ncbi:MAG: hypothetical protein HC810_05400, partial [Acaryochloridaceae cyanobacterium RL_2_7]|nr:hypothetical protein [Acaryochloridaceae cyanobacterium RL_2_7]